MSNKEKLALIQALQLILNETKSEGKREKIIKAMQDIAQAE
jgi:hypothetical protein